MGVSKSGFATLRRKFSAPPPKIELSNFATNTTAGGTGNAQLACGDGSGRHAV
jgi:hypothetical protein